MGTLNGNKYSKSQTNEVLEETRLDNNDVNPLDTYPDYFFKLAGKGKDMTFDDVEDYLPENHLEN